MNKYHSHLVVTFFLFNVAFLILSGGRTSLFAAGKKIVATGRHEAGPAEVWLNRHDLNSSRIKPPDPSIPRGALVVCYLPISSDEVKSRRFPGGEIEIVGEEQLMISDGQGKFTPGRGKYEVVTSWMSTSDRKGDGGSPPALKFVLYVPVSASRGPRTLRITSTSGPSIEFKDALRVCNPLVVLVDIDGMKLEEFYDALSNPGGRFPNLQKLVGKSLGSGKSENGKLTLRNFERGYALEKAVTVFPTVTFAGHAAIVSGADLNEFEMAGNEWFDRFENYKYAFTGDNLVTYRKGQGKYCPLCSLRVSPTMGDSHDSFTHGLANDRLLKGLNKNGGSTVFQAAAKLDGIDATSHVSHLMYYGDKDQETHWAYQNIVSQGLYIPIRTTDANDAEMVDKAAKPFRVRDGDRFENRYISTNTQMAINRSTDDYFDRLGISTLYFAGLDHVCHELDRKGWVKDYFKRIGDSEPEIGGKNGVQAFCLERIIDPQFGRFVNSLRDVTYKNATFVFTADHGQTTMKKSRGKAGDTFACFGEPRTKASLHKFQDLLWEFGYYPNGNYKFTYVETGSLGVGRRQSQKKYIPPLKYNTAVVGLNGGMAHIYLRKIKEGNSLVRQVGYNGSRPRTGLKSFEEWSQAPRFTQVEQVAAWFRRNLQANPDSFFYKKSLDMILIRNAEKNGWKADYQVYMGRDASDTPQILSLEEYFRTKEGQNFLHRNQWDVASDANFVADRIRRLKGKMSGDIILISNYPEYYCEYKPLIGDHGSLRRSDFEVPYLVARPGADKHDMKFLLEALTTSIDLKTKDRPANTDVKQTILKLLQPPDREFEDVGRFEYKLVKVSLSSGKKTLPLKSPYVWEMKKEGRKVTAKFEFPTSMSLILVKHKGTSSLTAAVGLKDPVEFRVHGQAEQNTKNTPAVKNFKIVRGVKYSLGGSIDILISRGLWQSGLTANSLVQKAQRSGDSANYTSETLLDAEKINKLISESNLSDTAKKQLRIEPYAVRRNLHFSEREKDEALKIKFDLSVKISPGNGVFSTSGPPFDAKKNFFTFAAAPVDLTKFINVEFHYPKSTGTDAKGRPIRYDGVLLKLTYEKQRKK